MEKEIVLPFALGLLRRRRFVRTKLSNGLRAFVINDDELRGNATDDLPVHRARRFTGRVLANTVAMAFETVDRASDQGSLFQ